MCEDREGRKVTKALKQTAALLLFAGLAAAAAPAAGELKIAVVDTGKAIQQTEEWKGFAQVLEQDLAADRDELETLGKQIEEIQQRAADEGDVMSEDEKRSLGKDLENKRIDADFRIKKFQKEVQDRQNEMVQKMRPKVSAVVNDLVEIERYDLVFERTNVGYVNPRHDITAKVTERLNERFADGTPLAESSGGEGD